MSLIEWIGCLLALSGLAFATALVFRKRWMRKSRWRALCAKVSLSVFSTLFLFLLAEIVFLCLPPATDSWAFTLASQRWAARHWKPLNSLGMRDLEPTQTRLNNRRILLAVGDSFTAGWGIADYRQRYQNRLADQLGDAWIAITMADGGWHTGIQRDVIFSLPAQPDVIVLQYYTNDIEGSAFELGKPFSARNVVQQPPPVIRSLVQRSYFLDFVYWRSYRFSRRDMNVDYRVQIDRLFEDARIWDHHRQQLLSVIGYAREREIPLYVLVIPHLVDVAASRERLSKVIGLLRSEGVPLVDVGANLQGLDTRQLVVNRLDSHANEKLHGLMANWLFARMRDELRASPVGR